MKQQSGRPVQSGEYFVWFCASIVSFTVLVVFGLLLLIAVNAFGSFWANDLYRIELKNGLTKIGEIAGEDTDAHGAERMKLRQGNRDVYGEDFVWLNRADIAKIERPHDAMAIERYEWGRFYGTVVGLKSGETFIASDPNSSRAKLPELMSSSQALRARALAMSKTEIGAVNSQEEAIRLELRSQSDSMPSARRIELLAAKEKLEAKYRELETAIEQLRVQDTAMLIMKTADGQERAIPVANIVRYYFPNELSFGGKLRLYAERVWEFVSAEPRESNTEGGVFPAIFGTVMVVMLMTIVVTPFGVIAAIYLREYARQGKFVSTVRIAVNNLAGVPSIVFGVFGVGFFIYFLGGSIDRLFFADALPTPTYGTGGILWASLTLALLTVPTVVVATEEGLAAIPRHLREGSYALGATKFETTWRVVLPALTPSILTGVILAVARAAGEVAPLMITGVVKLAPTLPVDSHWPFIHFDRKFMHLGFHIYDVGFQSPNVEAATPMVYSTTLLLLIIVVVLNLCALVLRNRLRKRYVTSAV